MYWVNKRLCPKGETPFENDDCSNSGSSDSDSSESNSHYDKASSKAKPSQKLSTMKVKVNN